MAKIPQNLLITFVFLSYSLLIKMLFTVSRSHLTSPFVPLIFCLLAKAKLHYNNCCSLFKLSCTTHTTCSCNVNNPYSQQFHWPVLFRFYSLLHLASLVSLFHAVPGPSCLGFILFCSSSSSSSWSTHPHTCPPSVPSHVPTPYHLFLHCQQTPEINK